MTWARHLLRERKKANRPGSAGLLNGNRGRPIRPGRFRLAGRGSHRLSSAHAKSTPRPLGALRPPRPIGNSFFALKLVMCSGGAGATRSRTSRGSTKPRLGPGLRPGRAGLEAVACPLPGEPPFPPSTKAICNGHAIGGSRRGAPGPRRNSIEFPSSGSRVAIDVAMARLIPTRTRQP